MTLQLPTPPTPQLVIENEPHFLRPDEAAAIAAFDAEMFPYPHLPDPYRDNPVGYWAEQANTHATSTEIVTVAGKIAAFMHVNLQESQKQGRQYAELQALAVAPEYQQQGIATFLAASAMRRALTEHNVVAFRFFGEHGTPMMHLAIRLGFIASSQPIWRRDQNGIMRAGQYFDLLVPRK